MAISHPYNIVTSFFTLPLKHIRSKNYSCAHFLNHAVFCFLRSPFAWFFLPSENYSCCAYTLSFTRVELISNLSLLCLIWRNGHRKCYRLSDTFSRSERQRSPNTTTIVHFSPKRSILRAATQILFLTWVPIPQTGTVLPPWFLYFPSLWPEIRCALFGQYVYAIDNVPFLVGLQQSDTYFFRVTICTHALHCSLDRRAPTLFMNAVAVLLLVGLALFVFVGFASESAWSL